MEKDTSLTPVMQQYLKIKSEHKNEVLFFRLGDFYEMFNEDALEISRLLSLTLTHRGTAPMCGVPYHAAKVYIARLLRLGRKIVICEQVGNPKAKGLTERKVVEIITPGTALESEYLEGNSNNFLAAMSVSKGVVGFAFIDVTTSCFKATSWRASEMAESFPKELGRCNPKEILLPQSLKNNATVQDSLAQIPEISISYYPDWDFNTELGYKKLTEQFKTHNLASFELKPDSAEVAPAGFLLDYLSKTTNSTVPHVSGIKVYHDSQYLVIDDSSRRNLEIVSNLRDSSSKYSLLECVNHASTAMGIRMIRQWLLYPLTDIKKITSRQNHVGFFYGNRNLLDEVREKLSCVLDVERLAGRIAMDRAHPKDLQALRSSLVYWLKIRKSLENYDFSLTDEQNSVEIIDLIQNSIVENPPTALTDGGIIKDGWSQELDHWRNIRDNFDKILAEYEAEERRKTGISTLKIKNTNAYGYFIEVSRGKLSSVPSDFIIRRSLVNGDRFTTARLQELEHELTEAGSKVLELERNLFVEVRNKLKDYVYYLIQTAEDISYIDATASFAYSAILHGWVRPVFSSSKVLKIEDGRHPVVEMHLPSGEFVPNSLSLFAEDKDSHSFALITGPNMAGKSTFLRQNALIVLLAQIGSFVPAKSAEIGLVDRIFCRVGASDNLARGESTFLVEMTETANILRSATSSSLVIMDEVGRGTSTEDGLSIAWAVSEYLLDSIKCRTLFATHYHELTRIENPSLILLCMQVAQQGESVTFLRKVKSGASENSFGIHVARLAGVPQVVIDRANKILQTIQSKAENNSSDIAEKLNSLPKQTELIQVKNPGLFSDEEILLDEILSAEPNSMTPIEALETIARWKKTLSGR